MNSSDSVHAELAAAEAARAAGNEGRARVCARRAAGLAARDFWERRQGGRRGDSAYDLLRQLAELPGLDPELRQAARHLTLRVSEAFRLPDDVDLIADARILCARLGE